LPRDIQCEQFAWHVKGEDTPATHGHGQAREHGVSGKVWRIRLHQAVAISEGAHALDHITHGQQVCSTAACCLACMSVPA
jgi:hypothetical protein